jgi:hypothetical protein
MKHEGTISGRWAFSSPQFQELDRSKRKPKPIKIIHLNFAEMEQRMLTYLNEKGEYNGPTNGEETKGEA